MAYVGLLVIFCSIIVGSLIDAYVTKKIIDLGTGDYAPWWPINGLIMIVICSVGAAASWLGDSHKQGREDKIGALLIFSSALILAWSSLGDIISACFQGWFAHGDLLYGAKTWFWNPDAAYPGNGGWWWCDWTLAGWISKLFGYAHAQFWAMIVSSIIGVGIVSAAWYYYLKKA